MADPSETRVQDEQGNIHVFPSEATPGMIAQAMNVKPPVAAAAPPQPSTWQVLTQPTAKTDAEYGGYRGAAGVAGATIKGLDDVARGTQGALEGLYNTVRHPIETIKGMAALPAQAAQVPGVIRDINALPDPTGTYLNAAQDTASQGAGQALIAIGASALPKIVPPAIRLGARSAEAAINQKLVPVRPIFNLNTLADEADAVKVKVPGRDLGLGSTTEEIKANLSKMAQQSVNKPVPAINEIKAQAAQAAKPALNVEKTPGQSPPESPYQVVNVPAGKMAKPVGDPYHPTLINPPMEAATSSTVDLHGYDPTSRTMKVQFKNGNVYQVKGVPQEIFDGYKNAESQGSFYQQNIKGRYDTALVGRVGKTAGSQVRSALTGAKP